MYEHPRALVLLVDDAPLIRDLVMDGLRARFPGLAVIQAGNVAEGYDLVTRHRPGLVLLDLSMPDGNGLTLARRIRDELPGVTVCICTLHDEPELRQAGADSGAAGFIGKQGDFWGETAQVVRSVFGDGFGPAPATRQEAMDARP